ncbi:hypothetical protein K461DRAFT_282492 [Myriangium duriaei CBS 260.36]|uniref:Nudix hydrolase domain-containing protein n=1 Tax=Myriangium duriaei CBS 260.36 TaxID=1168546 RepID=A0A9P4IV56_9PEZI|nr:hypothetical protein K461DRAFT_282492 [Myriangium duriaei CBS 260.36]
MDFSKMKSFLPAVPQLPKNINLPKNLQIPNMPHINFQIPQMAGLRTPPPPEYLDEKGALKASDPPLEINQAGPSSSSTDPTLLEPRPIDESRPKTNLDLINECDNFPYLHRNPELYLSRVAHYYHLQVSAHPGLCLGYVLPSVASVFDNLPSWSLDSSERTLTLIQGDDEPSRTAAVASTTAAMRALGHFAVLRGWRDEVYPVYGPNGAVLFSIERAAAPLLGIVQYGAHMTAYVREAGDGGREQIKIWTPRRSATKQTYPGMLDNTVAGGLPAGESPLNGMLREAEEEASLPESVVRERIKSVGVISYFHVRDARAGGETGLLEPENEYVFDLDLTGAGLEPKPSDGEAEDFRLLSIEEVREEMRKGQFKPNCALVLLDFFVRHGLLTAEEEPDYVEIVSRLHRVTEFPTR